jgi:hypothetical protein
MSGDGGGRDEAGEVEAFMDVELGGFELESLAPGAIAYDEEPEVGVLCKEVGGDIEEVVVAFKLEEPGDDTDHAVFLGEAVLLPGDGGSGGGEVGF